MTGCRRERRGVLWSGVLALTILSSPAWSRQAVSPLPGEAGAALTRDAQRCRTQTNLDACYDAIRWSPRDPALLVALGDALQRANRPAEAVRAYRRAGAIAPNFSGLPSKISAAEAKLSARPVVGNSYRPAATHAAATKRFANADPVTQSH